MKKFLAVLLAICMVLSMSSFVMADENPQGTITYAYTNDGAFWGEGTSNSTESFVVKLYEGHKEIASASLKNYNGIIDGDVYVTWSIPFDGADSNYWDVEWAKGYPKYNMNPTDVVLYADGEYVAQNIVQFNAPDNLNKIVAFAEDNDGVKAYANLSDAMGKFNGRKVNVLRDVKENISGFYGVELTTNVEGGVTITDTNVEDWIDFDDVIVGKGVTVDIELPYSGDSENVILGTLIAGDTYYHGYNAKTTVKDGGKIIVEGTTILRYNTNADAGIYIYGDDKKDTVEYKCGYYIGAYSGTFYAENANVECGYFLLKPSYDTAKEDEDTQYPPMEVTLDNSSLKVNGTTDGQNSFIIDDQAILNLKNGSEINNVRDFNILAGAEPAISMDETSIIHATNVNIASDVPLAADNNGILGVTFGMKLVGEGTTEKPYLISNLEQLKFFRDEVNEGKNYKGKVVQLAADIDLNSEEWTPIGNSTKKFQGTFDGNGKTISNLVISGDKSNVGLFGFTTDGEIKNLTVENAEVSGYLNVGVVAGTPYTSKYTNIKVTGHVEVNGFSYVGGVGGKNAYANWTNITVDADETSYVKANSVEDNGDAYRTYVGGVIGFMGEGGHTFENITSNIDVIGSTCDIGGITGIAHYGNNFINVTCCELC